MTRTTHKQATVSAIATLPFTLAISHVLTWKNSATMLVFRSEPLVATDTVAPPSARRAGGTS